MTILPKKKHQETRKNEQEHDIDNRSRHRNRPRESRAGRTQEENGVDSTSTNGSLSSPVYNDLESQEAVGLPHKRSRHTRQQSNFYSSSSSTSVQISKRNSKTNNSSRDGIESPHCDEDDDDEDNNEDGYNSSDEHGPRDYSKNVLPDENILERENNFEHQLREKKGFLIKQMATDGACMFRAVADQVYGDQEMHGVVRKHCMDYMVKNRDFFSPYITEDFTSYICRKRNDHSHGNHIEMQALSEMYNRPIEVYQYSYEPINTFHSRSYNADDTPPIRLSYHGNVHYNSIVDPYNPTVGVGLGLAGYKPRSEDDRLLKRAANESESLLLEQAMLEDKIKATDWEATDEHLAEIAARESYIQWLKDRQKHPSTTSEASSSKSTSTKSRQSPPREGANHHPPHEPPPMRRSSPKDVRRSPPHKNESDRHNDNNITNTKKKCKSSPTQPIDTSERLSSPPSSASAVDWSYALDFDSDWGSDPVLAAVLAQSQEEYFQSLAKNSNKSSESGGGSCSKF